MGQLLLKEFFFLARVNKNKYTPVRTVRTVDYALFLKCENISSQNFMIKKRQLKETISWDSIALKSLRAQELKTQNVVYTRVDTCLWTHVCERTKS